MSILDAPDRWTVEWSESFTSGKHVILRNPTTGQCSSGHDWTDWDRALGQALREIEAEGDLITEIERHLRRRRGEGADS